MASPKHILIEGTGAVDPDDPVSRSARTLGGATALCLAMFFVFPSRAFPIQSLIFTALLYILVLTAAAAGLRARAPDLTRALGGVAAMALTLFVLWAFVRWRGLQVPSIVDPEVSVLVAAPGRPSVIAYLLMAGGLVLGIGLSMIEPAAGPAGWPALRRGLMVALIGFSFYGGYQFFVGYEIMEEEFTSRFGHNRYMTTLHDQSIQHALQQRRIGGQLGNGNVFAAWLALLASLSLSGWTKGGSFRLKLLASVAYLMAVATIFLTRSRGGALTLIVGTVWAAAILYFSAMPLSKGENRAKPLTGRAGASSPALGLWILIAPLFAALARMASAETFAERVTNVATIRERLHYWAIAADVWRMNWFGGASPGGFSLYYPQFKPPLARESRYAHSWVLHTGAETGLVGMALLGAFVLVLAWLALGVWKAARRSDPGFAFAREANWLALGCGLLLFNGLFEYSLQMREFLVVLSILAGGLIGLHVRAVAARDPAGLRRPHAPLRGALAGALVAGAMVTGAFMIPRYQMATFWEGEARLAAEVADHARSAQFYARAQRWLPDHDGFTAARGAALTYVRYKFEESGRFLERAVRMNPLSARSRGALSAWHNHARRYSFALKWIDDAVEIYPHDAGYRMDRAEILLNMKNQSEASAELDFIVRKRLPLWVYQRPRFNLLTERVEVSLDHPQAE